jgi:hypothetical protein
MTKNLNRIKKAEVVAAEQAGAAFDRMLNDDRWLGFGYLGERRNQLQAGRAAEVAAADVKAMAAANEAGLTGEELFDGANSKNGRWYGDCMFGSYASPSANLYLPGQPQR